MSGLNVPLEDILDCFDGAIPLPIGSCSEDGEPNVTYLSVIHYVDPSHVALAYVFDNRTRGNAVTNGNMQVLLTAPDFRQYRADLVYERTETTGPNFDRMKSIFNAMASTSGISTILSLRATDIYRVTRCDMLRTERITKLPPKSQSAAEHLGRVAQFMASLADYTNFDDILAAALRLAEQHFGYDHAFIVALDESGSRLYTVASHGYRDSGVGSEILVGQGTIGEAARQRMALRVGSMSRHLQYSRAIRSVVAASPAGSDLEKEIKLPGLNNVESQLALPLMERGHLRGVLCFESVRVGRFSQVDEQIGLIMATYLATLMQQAHAEPDGEATPSSKTDLTSGGANTCRIRFYEEDDSLFIDNEYLVRGVSAKILLVILIRFLEEGRTNFTNKQMRLEPQLGLPALRDNFEARLVVLRRRLEERCTFMSIIPTGRGQFSLKIDRQPIIEKIEATASRRV